MMMMIRVLTLALALSGCVSARRLDTEKNYKKTLKFSVNGQKVVGVYSASKKSSYRIEIFVPQKPSFVKLTSCHQEKIFIKPGKEVEFDYRPDFDIEAGELPCLMEISALEESGKNQWGILDFQLDGETLPARVHCNGEIKQTHGSFICQSRYGLIQSIEFDEDVSSFTPEECNKIDPRQGKKFYFPMTEGNCFYLFSDKEGAMYRLVSFGYDEALLDD